MLNGDAKKTVLRMIPYGIYILTADDGKGNIAAATVNWVTQTAFAPPLLVVGVKAASGAYAAIKAGRHFALNMLGKDQKVLAFTFFRPADVADGKTSGQAYRRGETGAPYSSMRSVPLNAAWLRSSSKAIITLWRAKWFKQSWNVRFRGGPMQRSWK